MTKDEINKIIYNSLKRNFIIVFLIPLFAFLFAGLVFKSLSFIGNKDNRVMTVEKATKICEESDFNNWIRVDARPAKIKVQCFNRSWHLKEFLIEK